MLATALPVAAESPTPLWAWFVFGGIVLAMLVLDLVLFERIPHERRLKEAVIWSVVWIALALLFNVAVYYWKGKDRALEFTTAYLLEKALSVDNLFIFLVIFRYFGVKERYQPRVLFWGILGAFVMRGVLIVAGVELIHAFAWLLYVFGAILLFTGVKLLVMPEESYDPEKTLAFRIARRTIPVTPVYHEQRFFVLENGRRLATPLLLCLVMVEATDLVFAVDSIPACLAVSRDTFVVLTSNIFAILGLRALYFVLAGMMKGLRFLKPGLAIVLIFIGVKMILHEAAAQGLLPESVAGAVDIPVGASLAVVGGILGLSVLASLLFPKRGEAETPGEDKHANWVKDDAEGEKPTASTPPAGDSGATPPAPPVA